MKNRNDDDNEEIEKPKKKVKATKVANRNKEKRKRYRERRPDLDRNIVATVRSCGPDRATKMLDLDRYKTHKARFKRIIEEETLRYEERKERKAQRLADNEVQVRLCKKKVLRIKENIKNTEKMIKEVKISLDKTIDDEQHSALTRDKESLFKYRKTLRRKLSDAEKRLSCANKAA